jgi:hypothetical protein
MQGVVINGRTWLRGGTICHALGLTEESLRKLHQRNKEWFGPEDTTFVELPTEGGLQQVRLYSESGAFTIAVLSRQPQAVRLKMWLVRRLTNPDTPRLPNGTPARAGFALSLQETRLLDFLALHAEPGSKMQALIKDIRSGTVQPGQDVAVVALVNKYQGASALMAEARRVYSAINQEAKELGYDPDAVKRIARLAGASQLPQLPFGEAEVA